MITRAIKAAFEPILERSIDLPFLGPSGERWRAVIRSHDHPPFQEALQALGINPRGAHERAGSTVPWENLIREQLAERDGLNVNGNNAAERARTGEAEKAEIAAFFFPPEYPDIAYCRAEADKARPAVLEHLVVSWFEIAADGEEKQVSAKRLAADFASDEELPRVIPVDRHGSVKNHRVVYAEEKEGVALTVAVLVEAVQRHKFQERIVPLSKPFGSDEAPRATTEEGLSSLPPSPPDSLSDTGTAETESAPA